MSPMFVGDIVIAIAKADSTATLLYANEWLFIFYKLTGGDII